MQPAEKKLRTDAAEAASGSKGRRPVMILDGGCGMELKKRKAAGRKVAYNLQLFSTAALLETPQAVRELHEDYVSAGARVLTTSTFGISRQYLNKTRQSHMIPALANLSVKLAREAADASGTCDGKPAVRVAGSVPPLTECFRVDLVRSQQALAGEYKQLTEAMAEPKVLDLWLCETMSSLSEAQAASSACRNADPDLPLWVSFVLKKSLRAPFVEVMDGSSIVEAARMARELRAEALLFNCSTPELITRAFAALEQSKEAYGDVLLGAYGNFWEEHKPGWTIEQNESVHGKGDQNGSGLQVLDVSVQDYVHSARRWVAMGASIVGGCCGIGPEHIRAVADDLAQ